LLNWFERLIRRRRETPEFGWGALTLLDTDGDEAVLAHRCDWEDSAVVAVHNLSAEPRRVAVELGEVRDGDRAIDLLDSAAPVRPLDTPTLDCKLESYGFLWLRLQREDQRTAP
jgi:maltose alpha-D-glucosyltransferase/alpha-amylase